MIFRGGMTANFRVLGFGCHKLKQLIYMSHSDRYDAKSRFFISAPGKIKVFCNFYTLLLYERYSKGFRDLD